MIIALAGHIDHGKSALVKRLSGAETDRLPQEKLRGITIEPGFAYWGQKDGSVTGFVDVPGHERFVHRMMVGAQGADIFLLVVAADDGIMAQTREHLEILTLLGIQQGVVAISKCDLVTPERIREVEAEIATLFATGPLAGSPVFPLSSRTGAGMDALAAWLIAQHTAHQPKSAARSFRLAVDRSFVLDGAGVVVTGAVLDGSISAGDSVIVSPSGITARVRGLHAQNRVAQTGRAGDRCALNLAGPDIAKNTILRGDMIVKPEAHAPAERIDVEICLASGTTRGYVRGLPQWAPVRVHHAASETGGHVVLLNDQPQTPGTVFRAQLVLERPVSALAHDRFVLRDPSASITLAGGRFLDLRAPARKRRAPERVAILDALALSDTMQALTALLTAHSGAVDVTAFARDRGADNAQALAWLTALGTMPLLARAGGKGIESGGLYAVSAERLALLETEIREQLGEFHAASPDLTGMGLERLRLQCAPKIAAPLFRLLLQNWSRDPNFLVIEGAWVRLASHSTALTPEDEQLFASIRPLLSGTVRFKPPRVRDIASLFQQDESAVRRLLHRHARAGLLDEVATDHFFLRPSVAELADIAADLEMSEGGWFSASAYRDCLDATSSAQTGRKVAIHILEFFDKHGFTIRRGDLRRVNAHRRTLFARQDDADESADA